MASQPLDEFLNSVVVLDTRSNYIYIGTLQSFDAAFLTLCNAAVYDCSETSVTREQLISEAKRNGLQASRKIVKVKFAEVMSLSPLADVIAN